MQFPFKVWDRITIKFSHQDPIAVPKLARLILGKGIVSYEYKPLNAG